MLTKLILLTRCGGERVGKRCGRSGGEGGGKRCGRTGGEGGGKRGEDGGTIIELIFFQRIKLII